MGLIESSKTLRNQRFEQLEDTAPISNLITIIAFDEVERKPNFVA